MNLFSVDRESCKQDGICAAVCPTGVISVQKGGYPAPVDDAENMCIGCGHCVAACSTGSLSHREVAVGQCPPIRKELHLSAEHCEHFLRSRRSIRVYKSEPVARADISKLIEIARYAPSGHNCQCVEWLVFDKREEIHRLAGIVADWMRFVVDTMPEESDLSRYMGKVLKNWEKGNDVILRNAPVLIVTHAEVGNRMAPSSCTLALSYLELAATSMGLGSCWAGYLMVAATTFPPLKEALCLPKSHVCHGGMMVGYPKFSYHRLPARKPPSITWR